MENTVLKQDSAVAPLRHCSGDCKQCLPFQRLYCASQIGYTTMGLVSSLAMEVASLRASVQKLSETMSNTDLVSPDIELAQ
jgi:hypothetical protein